MTMNPKYREKGPAQICFKNKDINWNKYEKTIKILLQETPMANEMELRAYIFTIGMQSILNRGKNE